MAAAMVGRRYAARSSALAAPVEAVPGLGFFKAVVDVVDVLHALVLEPRLKGGRALFAVNRDALFPGGAPAQNAREVYPGFPRPAQRFGELLVANPRAQIDERPAGQLRRLAVALQRLIFAVGLFAGCRRRRPRRRRG